MSRPHSAASSSKGLERRLPSIGKGRMHSRFWFENEKMKKQKNNFTKKQKNNFTIFPINPKVRIIQLKYYVGRESACSIVGSILSAVIVFHPVVSCTMSAVAVLHSVASWTLSAAWMLAQISEVLCRPLEYFRRCRLYSDGRYSIPSRSAVYYVGRCNIPFCRIAYFVGRHDTFANRGSTLSAVRVLPLTA